MADIDAPDSCNIRYSVECGFILKRVRDMIITNSQMHRTDKYSQYSSSVWLNGWVFVYELSGCGFESRCSHLNFRFCACFEQGVPWHPGNYRLWIHSETHAWHDNNMQLRYLTLYTSYIQSLVVTPRHTNLMLKSPRSLKTL